MKYGMYSMRGFLYEKIKEICDEGIIKDEKIVSHRAISWALQEYLKHYEASYPFKQRTREVFQAWLIRIEEKYEIVDSNDMTNDFLEEYGSKDIAIRIIKELHPRSGITKKELSAKLGITPRAVLSALIKLGLESDNTDIEPYYLGDQPIRVKVKKVKKEICGTSNEINEDEGKISPNAKRFYTENTLHPIILQENMYQVYKLVSCLLYQVDDNEGQTLLYSVVQDIWFQLSEYAKIKIEAIMGQKDPHLIKYLKEMDDLPPTQETLGFITEQEMKMRNEMNESEIDDYLDKVYGRRRY